MDNSIMDKIIKVHFESDKYYCYGIQGLVQWDKCQKLEISGLDISDEIVEVHFSLDEVQGKMERMYGTVKDGVIHADIPTFILEGPEYICSGSEVYNAYAWVYVSDEESAETIRKMEFEIKAKPKPNGYASPDKQDSFLQEIRQVLTDTKQIAQSVRNDADAGKFNGNASINQEALLQLAIKPTTEKAPFHHITDSANMKVVDFGMSGKTEQDTVAGNQLFDISKFNSDDWITNNGDGTLTSISYTPRLRNKLSVCCPNIAVGMTVIATATGSNGIYFGNAFKSYNIPFEVTQEMIDTDYIAFYSLNNTASADNPCVISNIMINEGTTAKPIEPYTNGPSPNPDYPQEIVNARVYNEATGRYEIGCRVENQNLFVVPLLTSGFYLDQYKGITVESDMYYVSDYINVQKSLYKYITFYGELTKKRIIFYDKNKNYISGNGSNNTAFYATIPANTEWFRISFYCEDIENIAQKEIVIERSNSISIVSEYVEGKSQPFTLTSPVPLTKWDYLTKRDGVWGWSIWQLPYVFNGSENWYSSTSRKGFSLGDVLPSSFSYRMGYSNQALYFNASLGVDKAPSNSLCCGMMNNVINILNSSIYDDTLSDYGLANWKAHLNENPLEVITYADEEQAFHPLPESEQALLNNLETYYGVTNVYNDQGCPMWLTYVADTKLYTDQQIAKQIAQTQALILEN